MIAKDETALTQEQYDGLRLSTTPAMRRLTLQRINWVFESFDEQATRAALWDVEWCAGTTSQAIRTYREADQVLHIERFNGTTWSAVGTTVASVGPVAPSVVCSEDAVRIFYYKAGDICYIASSDGGATWGSEVEVAELAGTVCLAATGLNTVHVAASDDHNTHLFLYEYIVDAWVEAESDIHYPYEWDGFDAETIGGRDVLVFTARGPTRYESPRQGVWAIRVKNHHWSDPIEVEVIDEYDEDNVRAGVRLSQFNGRLWASYVATDGGHVAMCYAASSDGLRWQHRQPVGGSVQWEGKITHFGDYVYLMDADTTYRSASTVLSGHSTVEEEITDYVDGYRVSRQGMHQSSLVMHNEDGHFDSYLDTFNRYQLLEELGYVVGGASLVQQVALTEIDAVAHREDVPANMIEFVCRDHLSWMADRSEADHYQEWVSQLRHYDDFVNVNDPLSGKEVLNTGLAHTAQMGGHWDTDFNELHLCSNNKEGLALCSISKFIGHTVVQEAVRVPSAGNDEWAGITFRALDEDNYWCAYYNEGDDTIKLRQKRGGEWQSPLASSTTLGYGPQMWIWIRVEAKLSLFTVYCSSDGLTWLLAFSPCVDITNSFERAAFQEGYVGHAGYGASDEDQEPVQPPAYDPPAPYSGTDSGARIFGTNVGIVVTNLVTKLEPHYYLVNTGFVTADDKYVQAVAWDPEGYQTLYALTKTGVWINVGFPSGTWTQITTAAAIYASHGYPANFIYPGDLRMSIEADYFAIAFSGPDGGGSGKNLANVIARVTGLIYSHASFTGKNVYAAYGGRPRIQWAQHSAALTLYHASPCYYSMGYAPAKIRKSIDRGVNWAESTSVGESDYPSITIPYDSPGNTGDLYGYCGGEGNGVVYDASLRKTINAAATWTAMISPFYCRKVGTGGHHNYIWILASQSRFSENAGQDWTLLPTGSGGTESNALWVNGELKRVVITNGATIKLWDRGWAAVQDRTGDLADTGATAINCIERFGEDLF